MIALLEPGSDSRVQKGVPNLPLLNHSGRVVGFVSAASDLSPVLDGEQDKLKSKKTTRPLYFIYVSYCYFA
jgi:hypothetical protein